jgi:hypothetical protein
MSVWSIKRVPLDFDWPPGYLWHGYINPWPGPIECDECCGTGLNNESLKLYRNFKRWAPRLTDSETTKALKSGITEKDLFLIQKRVWNEVDNPLIRFYLTEIRAKQTNVWGFCSKCGGDQVVTNPNPAIQQLYADVNLFMEWKPIEPPKGVGWQLWQIQDSDEFPVSIVYKSETELAHWCSTHFKSDYEGWVNWITQEGLKIPEKTPEFKLKSENVVIFTQTTNKA